MRLALLVLLVVASAVDASDPASAGRFAVGSTTVTLVDGARDRTLVTEVWYPARTAGREAAVRRGRYPLVLVAHGHCGFRTNHEFLTVHLASRGFVVAAPDIPAFCVAAGAVDLADPPLDLSFLRATFHDRRGPIATLARAVRGRRTAVVGHSLGGLAVVNAAGLDPDLSVVVGLAPATSAAAGEALAAVEPERALIAFGGSADTTAPTAAFTQPFFDAFVAAGGRPAFLVKITGGTHSGFTDMDSHLTPEALAAQQAVVNHYVTAFLGRYLSGRRRDGRWLVDADDGTVAVTAEPR